MFKSNCKRSLLSMLVLLSAWLIPHQSMALSIYPIKPINPIAKPIFGCAQVPSSLIITLPGRYCLKNDLISSDGRGIEIRADNVTLNMGGHTLSNNSNVSDTVGIYSLSGQGITVTNGTIMGYSIGIKLGTNPYLTSASVPYAGNYTVSGVTIRNAHSVNSYAVGIYVYASVATIINSNVSDVSGNYAIGIGANNYVGSNLATANGKLIIENNSINSISSTGEAAHSLGVKVINYIYQTSITPNFDSRINGNSVNNMQSSGTVDGISIVADFSNVLISPSTVLVPGVTEVGSNYIANLFATTVAIGVHLECALVNVDTSATDGVMSISFQPLSTIIHDSYILLTGGVQRVGVYTPPWYSPVQFQDNMVGGAIYPYLGHATGSNNSSF